MANKRTFSWIALLLLVAAPVSRGDVLTAVNGERFVGTIVQETPDNVVFRSEIGGEMTVPRAKIRDLQRAPAASSPAPTAAAVATTSPSTTTASTGPASPPFYLPPGIGHDGYDWIQLVSDEWLKGRLKYLRETKVVFESDKLDELTLKSKNVKRIYTGEPMVIKFEGLAPTSGKIAVEGDVVRVESEPPLTLSRSRLEGITPGGEREIDFWAGKLTLGYNLQSGNTDQQSLNVDAELARRTAVTRLKLSYLSNFSEVEGSTNTDTQRINELYDIRLHRELFVRPLQSEYYRDPQANIDYRLTAGAGLGYDIFNRDDLEWTVFAGPGYQYTQYETVESGQPGQTSTLAAVLQSSFRTELTNRLDLILSYNGTFTGEEAGLYTQHAASTLEFEITHLYILDLSLYWDYTQNPQPRSDGSVPDRSDLRLNVNMGLKF